MRIAKLLRLSAATLLFAAPALAGGAPGAAPAPPAAPATPAAFDHLKALAGKWQGKTSDGKVMRVSYEVDAAGTAVVEKLENEGEPPMVTVYYPDGQQVMLTHYCLLGNQPRMRTSGPAKGAGGNQMSFAFVDATNLKPGGDHMDSVKFTFTDADHFSQVWTLKHGGKATEDTFNFERAK
jgi:hypothetical protein